MPSPLDLRRLAVRIESLACTDTHDWHPSDEMEFRARLPGGRDPRALPSGRVLREMAERAEPPDAVAWALWIHSVGHLESLVHANHPLNPQRMIRDLLRGRIRQT